MLGVIDVSDMMVLLVEAMRFLEHFAAEQNLPGIT
jgi:hypothetical protein